MNRDGQSATPSERVGNETELSSESVFHLRLPIQITCIKTYDKYYTYASELVFNATCEYPMSTMRVGLNSFQ